MNTEHFFIVGLTNIENKGVREKDDSLLYCAWLFKDIKTHNGAVRRALNYAKNHRYAKGENMIPVLREYRSPMYSDALPVRVTYV